METMNDLVGVMLVSGTCGAAGGAAVWAWIRARYRRQDRLKAEAEMAAERQRIVDLVNDATGQVLGREATSAELTFYGQRIADGQLDAEKLLTLLGIERMAEEAGQQ